MQDINFLLLSINFHFRKWLTFILIEISECHSEISMIFELQVRTPQLPNSPGKNA